LKKSTYDQQKRNSEIVDRLQCTSLPMLSFAKIKADRTGKNELKNSYQSAFSHQIFRLEPEESKFSLRDNRLCSFCVKYQSKNKSSVIELIKTC